MFRLAKERQVLWPVVARIPSEDGSGKILEEECKVLFLLMSSEDIQAWHKMDDKDSAEELSRRIMGWQNITDQDGNPVPFTPENKVSLLKDVFFATAATIALWQASRGAPAKNS